MIDKLTEHGLALHDQVFDLERLCARQQATIQRQAALLKQKRDSARAVNAEILYPIGWGGKMEYPYPRAVAHARQLIETYGVDRFLWGSDMPNVARYCTFRQSLTYIADHAPFLSDADRRKLFRDNALALYGGEGAA